MKQAEPDIHSTDKNAVREHWEQETCGTRYGDGEYDLAYYRSLRETRYKLEPHIAKFQNALNYRGKEVLEIGVGAGSEFLGWYKAGVEASGVDLTDAAIEHTRRHLGLEGFEPTEQKLFRADAESLPFPDSAFDMVYSYGVLHHSPDTAQTLREACRVLRPGGELRIMLYHRPCWTGLLLWIMHGLMKGKPFMSMREAIHQHLESPGTKSYTIRETHALLNSTGFTDIATDTALGPGDLLTIKPSAKYDSSTMRVLWKIYPRWLVRLLGKRFGILMMISAKRNDTPHKD
jgi:ubiquinone/menaquinone biosynthesis C-methylase UbiE